MLPTNMAPSLRKAEYHQEVRRSFQGPAKHTLSVQAEALEEWVWKPRYQEKNQPFARTELALKQPTLCTHRVGQEDQLFRTYRAGLITANFMHAPSCQRTSCFARTKLVVRYQLSCTYEAGLIRANFMHAPSWPGTNFFCTYRVVQDDQLFCTYQAGHKITSFLARTELVL